MGMTVTDCRGGVRIWRLCYHGKGARFNNFTIRKLRTLLTSMYLLILCLIPKKDLGWA